MASFFKRSGSSEKVGADLTSNSRGGKYARGRDASPAPPGMSQPDDIRIDMLSAPTSNDLLIPPPETINDTTEQHSSDFLPSFDKATGGSRPSVPSSPLSPASQDSLNAAAAIMGARSRHATTPSDIESEDDFKDRELFEGAAHVHYVHRAPWLRAGTFLSFIFY